MLVKVTPKTYRTIFKLFEKMEEEVQEVPVFSLEMELEEAVKFFSKLLQENLNNEVIFELQWMEERNQKEVTKKEIKDIALPKHKEKQRQSDERRSVTQEKIIEILKSDGIATIPQMMKKMQLSRNAVNSACMRLLEKGIIQRLERGKYELVEKSKPEEQKQMEELQLPDGKKQEQKKLAEAKSGNLFTNWKYYEVVDYIFTKTAFIVDNLRKKLATKSNEIVEVIQLALKEGYITETEQDGRYQVEDIFRLYYLLIKINRPVSFPKILSDFRGKPEQLTTLLIKCEERGLIKRIKTENNTICYEAVK